MDEGKARTEENEMDRGWKRAWFGYNIIIFLPTESLCVVESILMNQYVLIVQQTHET